MKQHYRKCCIFTSSNKAELLKQLKANMTKQQMFESTNRIKLKRFNEKPQKYRELKTQT